MDKVFQLKMADINGEGCHTIRQGEKFNYQKQWWIAERIEEEPEAGYISVFCSATDGEVVWPTTPEKVVKGAKKSSKKTSGTKKVVKKTGKGK